MEIIYHGQTKNGKRFTVVGIYDEKQNAKEINYGISICGPRDQFTKKLGRTIAKGRALKNPTIKQHLKKKLPYTKQGYNELKKSVNTVFSQVEKSIDAYQKLLTEQYKDHKRKIFLKKH